MRTPFQCSLSAGYVERLLWTDERQLLANSVEKVGHGFQVRKYALEIEIFALSRGCRGSDFAWRRAKMAFPAVSTWAI